MSINKTYMHKAFSAIHETNNTGSTSFNGIPET